MIHIVEIQYIQDQMAPDYRLWMNILFRCDCGNYRRIARTEWLSYLADGRENIFFKCKYCEGSPYGFRSCVFGWHNTVSGYREVAL